VNVYFDASVIVSFVINDALSPRVDAYINSVSPIAVVSDFAAAEVASALNLRVRAGTMDQDGARAALGRLDLWRAQAAASCQLTSTDILVADAFLRRLDLPLRAPDAIHLAIAQRLDIAIATGDLRMKDCAVRLGIKLAEI
jgi:predicted nucleic acid-binding protein